MALRSTTRPDSLAIKDVTSCVFALALPKMTGVVQSELAQYGVHMPQQDQPQIIEAANNLANLGDKIDDEIDGIVQKVDLSQTTAYSTFEQVITNYHFISLKIPLAWK